MEALDRSEIRMVAQWRMGYGRPYRSYPAKYAAEQLLANVLQNERDANGFGRSSYSLSHAGPLRLASDTTAWPTAGVC